jgi:intracellular sulfur oxidation DsrE/DsrF family protein
MRRISSVKNILITLLLIGVGSQLYLAAVGQEAWAQPTIRIDIPVTLKQANVVFNVSHLDFVGDIPAGIKYMNFLATEYKQKGTQGRIIGIFHGTGAYLTLNDKAYNAYRLAETGNPYKNLLVSMLEQGVQIEACAVSMKSNGWGNEDLLPGVKVNAGAIGRLIQLVQEGYIQMEP